MWLGITSLDEQRLVILIMQENAIEPEIREHTISGCQGVCTLFLTLPPVIRIRCTPLKALTHEDDVFFFRFISVKRSGFLPSSGDIGDLLFFSLGEFITCYTTDLLTDGVYRCTHKGPG